MEKEFNRIDLNDWNWSAFGWLICLLLNRHWWFQWNLNHKFYNWFIKSQARIIHFCFPLVVNFSWELCVRSIWARKNVYDSIKNQIRQRVCSVNSSDKSIIDPKGKYFKGKCHAKPCQAIHCWKMFIENYSLAFLFRSLASYFQCTHEAFGFERVKC